MVCAIVFIFPHFVGIPIFTTKLTTFMIILFVLFYYKMYNILIHKYDTKNLSQIASSANSVWCKNSMRANKKSQKNNCQTNWFTIRPKGKRYTESQIAMMLFIFKNCLIYPSESAHKHKQNPNCLLLLLFFFIIAYFFLFFFCERKKVNNFFFIYIRML